MTLPGDQTRERLLTCGRDLYLESGLEGFSLREVARRAKVSAPAIYRHFDNKGELLGEVCAAGFRIFSSYLLRALTHKTPHERLRATSTQYLRFGLENPLDYRFIFMGDAKAKDAIVLPPNSPEVQSTFQFLVDRVRECMDARVMKKGDAVTVATLLWTNVHGLVSLRLSGHLQNRGNETEFTRFYQHAVDQVLKGLAA